MTFFLANLEKLGRNVEALFFLCSADDVRVISGCLEDTVLLPCPCSRNPDKEFKWQMDEPQRILVLKNTKNESSFGDSYKGRVTMFLPEESNNCSVLLANITADDQGKYKCIFYNQKRYMRKFVYLNVSGESLCFEDNLEYFRSVAKSLKSLLLDLFPTSEIQRVSDLNSSVSFPLQSKRATQRRCDRVEDRRSAANGVRSHPHNQQCNQSGPLRTLSLQQWAHREPQVGTYV